MSKNHVMVALLVLGVGCGDNKLKAADPDASDPQQLDAAVPVDAVPDSPPDSFVAPILNVNPGFETGALTGWMCNGNAACTLLNTGAHSGTYAASATNLPNDYSGFRINVLPLVCPSDPTCATGVKLTGKTLRFHGFIKPVGAATAVRLVLRWNCPADTMGGYQWLQNIANPTADTWNEYTKDFLIPDCNYAASNENLYVYTGTEGATEIQIDDLTITEVLP